MPPVTAPYDNKKFDFEEYYKIFFPLIFKICANYSQNSMDTMDLTHDVFIKCYENFSGFRDNSKISTWMYRVAVNSGIDHLRKKRMDKHDPKTIEKKIISYEETPEIKILNKIALEKIFSKFSHKTKEILFLYFIENLSQAEISKIKGVSRQAVKKHLDKFDINRENCVKTILRN